MKTWLLARRIISILEENGCLNTMEICRILNGIEENKGYSYCRRRFAEEAGRERTGFNRCMVSDCRIKYYQVHRICSWLARIGRIKTAKLRFWDRGGAHPTDLFRFWWIKEEDFHERILSKTLVPF